jgi:ferredoxin
MQMIFLKLKYDPAICDFCGACVAVCPHDAIELQESDFNILEKRCTLCKNCVYVCPVRALEFDDEKPL